MEIKDLSREQQVALVALVEALAVTDRNVTDEEAAEIGMIADALGDEPYRQLLDEAEQRFPDQKRLRKFLATITDQESRELIYTTALEAAEVEPPVGAGRSAILDWLATTWAIRVDIQPDDKA